MNTTNDIDLSVRAALALWSLPSGVTLRLINVSENRTYLLEAGGGFRQVLRLHRAGYHTRGAIESELAWMLALNEQSVIETPKVVLGLDGQAIQRLPPSSAEELPCRYLVMFEFIDGEEPQFGQDHELMFENLGCIAAQAHQHAQAWQRPAEFERLSWDLDAVFGSEAKWGHWRLAPGMNPVAEVCLQQVQECVIRRLLAYGSGKETYGLIHADMRLANLLVDKGGRTRLIDFDDCGFGWYLYDFAAAISFMEDHSEVVHLKQAWLRGYCRQRALRPEDLAEMDTFVMLRRLALCGWMGSHSEVDIVQQLQTNFLSGTVELGRRWLAVQEISSRM